MSGGIEVVLTSERFPPQLHSVLVAGGKAHYAGNDYEGNPIWMSVNELPATRIIWEVKWWAEIPSSVEPPSLCPQGWEGEEVRQPSYAWLRKYWIASEDFLSVVQGAQHVFATHFQDGKPVGDGRWRIESIAKAVELIEQASKTFIAAMDSEPSPDAEPRTASCLIKEPE